MIEFDEVNRILNNDKYVGFYVTKTGISIDVDKKDDVIVVFLYKHSS